MSPQGEAQRTKGALLSLSDPMLGEEERQAVIRVLESGWITMGDRVSEFEKAFAARHDASAAVAVSSATAGLHMALAGLGIGPGDEVLVPSLSFVATSNAVIYTGARPVFVDIERVDAPHISIEDAARKMTDRTRAVIVMHYGGYTCDMTRWSDFAARHGLHLIEDAAHAVGHPQAGRHSRAAVFSFYGNKNMTTAEGGMIITGDAALNGRLRLLRSHGMTTNTLDRVRGHAHSYDVTMLGFNYRLDEIRAAIGLVQLDRLPAANEKRRALTKQYRRLFRERLPSVAVPFGDDHETVAHLMSIVLPPSADRAEIMRRLRDDSILTSIHYPCIHLFSYYQEFFAGTHLPHSESFSQRELTLPLHPAMTESDVNHVVSKLCQILS